MANQPTLMLWVEADKCTGCRLCEVACVLEHEGFCMTGYARLRIDKDEVKGTDSPRVCQHCADAPCAANCPTAALFVDDDGIVQLNVADCNGCRACYEVCPHDAIFFEPSELTIRKCDLCHGDPACVKACESQALLLVDRRDIAAGLPAKAAETNKISADGLKT